MLHLSIAQALCVWTDLELALAGRHGFGGHTAEIYLYRLMPYDPAAHTALPSARRDEAETAMNRMATENLCELVEYFIQTREECADVRIQGVSFSEWSREILAYRVQVEVVPKRAVAPASAPRSEGSNEAKEVFHRFQASLEKEVIAPFKKAMEEYRAGFDEALKAHSEKLRIGALEEYARGHAGLRPGAHDQWVVRAGYLQWIAPDQSLTRDPSQAWSSYDMKKSRAVAAHWDSVAMQLGRTTESLCTVESDAEARRTFARHHAALQAAKESP